MKKLLLLMVALLVSVSAAAAQTAQTPAAVCEDAVPAAEPSVREFAEPEEVLEPDVDYRAVFCTEAGPIYVDLLEEYTPITVNSFVFLAQSGYYNNTTFHRVLEGFMAQGGDPTGTGMGGPGYQFKNEPVGFLTFDKPGWLAMANAGPDTNGSQFFITVVPTPNLDLGYTIFGEVLEGQENVENIKLRDPDQNPDFPGARLDTVVIITDPETVQTTYEAPEPATQESVEGAFDRIRELVPEGSPLAIDEDTTGTFTSDDVVTPFTPAVGDDYKAYLQSHNHEYRVATAVLNGNCDTNEIGFLRAGYALDSYATQEDAAAAIADEALNNLLVSSGLTFVEESPNAGIAMYTQSVEACEQQGLYALTHLQRGHFVATVEVTIPADQAGVEDRYLAELVAVRLFEPIMGDILRREIR
jgi:cyclophilin family peptidyl-prolyl cis-trans isomerase